MKRLLTVLLALLLLPAAVLGEESEEAEGYNDLYWWEDPDATWAELARSGVAGVEGDTLVISEGVTVLGWVEESDFLFEGQPYEEGKWQDGPQFDRSYDETDFSKASLPSTLRCIGGEAFIGHDFETFTIPDGLELLADGAFMYCDFDVLRIESTLPVEVILGSLYDCTVMAYEVPADHPSLRSVDGVLFSKDGKTLIDYPDGRQDTHYDVPAGVERIRSIENEALQTVSLPIGLQTLEDFCFAGCTHLQAIALPLTVREIGHNVFYDCVSLELVSLPEGLTADRNENRSWTEYYADDALFRGDNGDTIAGAGSVGRVNAPGRLFTADGKETYTLTWDGAKKETLVNIYETADAASARSWYRQGKTVYMGLYQNGRVALYEPLGGIYSGTGGYGTILGWADIADVRYLRPEALFAYAAVRPRSPMPVWWNHLPDYASWTPWETVIPLDGRTYKSTLFGAFVRFEDPESHAIFCCAIQDADLTRVADDTDNVYGIVYNADFMADIPLTEAPDAEVLTELTGGTQVRILDEDGGWVLVTDGEDTGWVRQDHVRIVPEEQEETKE